MSEPLVRSSSSPQGSLGTESRLRLAAPPGWASLGTALFLVCLTILSAPQHSSAAEPPRKLVLVAGRPSHPPRMHEFNAGVQLLQKCLRDSPLVETHVVLNGWPAEETIFQNAHAIVFYMDGGGGHELVKENGRRLKLAEEWAARGVGLGCMHFGVEVVPDQAGQQFKKWIGGHYEHMLSCNPIWEPEFTQFPEHPVSRGVKPFRIRDEWYFHMRFLGDLPGHRREQVGEVQFQPILVATPPDAVRDGPYVYPAGPYPHIQANKGRPEAMLWCVERPDHGRGFGFTGGHFHDNWGNDQFRKVVLNALVWLTGAEVPAGGIESRLTPADLEAHLDSKQK
ncbi:MAG: ThuA domain-containing protein [Planctomycetaceae bacterium]